jgi:hypothetical protein
MRYKSTILDTDNSFSDQFYQFRYKHPKLNTKLPFYILAAYIIILDTTTNLGPLLLRRNILNYEYWLPGGPYNNKPFHGDKIPVNNCGYYFNNEMI